MDGDEFTRRYQLLQKLVEGTVTTYLARASSGDRVMTHFLQGSHAAQLLDRLDALPEERRRHLRTVTDLDGTPVVVTDYLDDFDSFRSWVSGSGSDVPETGGSERTESDGPGEFTRLFEAPTEPSEPPAEPSGPAPEAAGEASGAESGSEEPGEFTRLFEAPGGGDEAASGGVEGPDAGPEDAPSEERSAPREEEEGAPPDATEPTPSGGRPFLFRSPVQGDSSRGTEEPAASGGEEPSERDRTSGPDQGSGEVETSEPDEEEPGTDEPGELTRMLRAESESEPSSGDPDRVPDERASDEPGEFTRKFGSAGDADDVEPPGRGEATGGGSATDAFRSPETPSAGEADADDPGAATGGTADRGDREPGDFTRMFGSRGGPAGSSPDAGSPGVGGSMGGSTSHDDPDDYLRRLGAEPPPSSPGPGPGAVGETGRPTGPPSESPPPEEAGVDDSREGGGLSGRGPSDYTRIVRGRGPQGAGASAGAAPTPAAPPSREEETRHWPYLAALGGIFLIAIVLLVIFLVTGGGDEAAPAEGAGEGEPATEEVVSPPEEGG